jgi:type IV secretion system protein VirB2
MLSKQKDRRTTMRMALGRLLAGTGLVAAGTLPAYAQIQQLTTVMTNVQSVLTGVSVTMFTISIIWAGFKMAFQHAKWSEISNIVIGGVLVGGAAAIAAWLI